MINEEKNKLFYKTLAMLIVGTVSIVIVLLIINDICCSIFPTISNPIIVFTIVVLFTTVGLNCLISFVKLWNKLFL
jgi:hypothetical protein